MCAEGAEESGGGCRGCGVREAADLLGRSVRRCTAHDRFGLLADGARQAPVREDGAVTLLAEAHVLGLEVAMHEAARVRVPQRGE